jgi:hypothetical protein
MIGWSRFLPAVINKLLAADGPANGVKGAELDYGSASENGLTYAVSPFRAFFLYL